jgi:hypothetical protein
MLRQDITVRLAASFYIRVEIQEKLEQWDIPVAGQSYKYAPMKLPIVHAANAAKTMTSS